MPKEPGEPKQENGLADLTDEELVQEIKNMRRKISIWGDMLMEGGVPNNEERRVMQRSGEEQIKREEELEAKYSAEYKRRTGSDYREEKVEK